MKPLIVSEAELRRVIGLDREGLEAVAGGFARLSAGEVVQPPIMRIDIPEHQGEVDVKSAFVKGLDSFAVKLSSGFFENHRRGLPSASGLMIVLDAETGIPQAVLLEGGYLTDLRTALAGALAAEHLAPKTVRGVGVLGAGAQARWQLRALGLVREFARVRVWSRHPERARRYAEEMSAELGLEVEAAATPEAVVRASELIVTTTPATEPILRAAWLREGQHVTAMGSDAEHKNELEPGVFARADRVVCDSRAQCLRLGELRSAAAGVLSADDVTELGEIVSGQRPGREREEEITVCDLTGTGVQDTVIARLALARLS